MFEIILASISAVRSPVGPENTFLAMTVAAAAFICSAVRSSLGLGTRMMKSLPPGLPDWNASRMYVLVHLYYQDVDGGVFYPVCAILLSIQVWLCGRLYAVYPVDGHTFTYHDSVWWLAGIGAVLAMP